MTQARPFATADGMAAVADRIWSSLEPADWLEAFASHPRIGEREAGGAGRAGQAGHAGWAAEEQAGAESAAREVRERLARGNAEYEARFGYIFIVCATGRTVDEMLRTLEQRLGNDADTELRVAAGEQRKITRLRLAKLLEPPKASTP